MTDEQMNEQLSGFFHYTFPKDFITDPAMRDLLQQKLLEEGWAIRIEKIPDEDKINIRMVKDGERRFNLTYTRDRIWPLAYLKAHGLEVQS